MSSLAFSCLRKYIKFLRETEYCGRNLAFLRPYLSEMQNTSGVVLMSYSAFKSNPPNEFKVNKEGSDSIRLPNNSLVTIISDKEEFTNTEKTNMVKTISDLEAFRSQILNRPLLLLVTCGKHVPHGQRYATQILHS